MMGRLKLARRAEWEMANAFERSKRRIIETIMEIDRELMVSAKRIDAEMRAYQPQPNASPQGNNG